MDVKDVRNIAYRIKGCDNYYMELKALQEDLEFFTLYIKRNQKSTKFGFRIIPTEFSYTKSLSDIFEATGFYKDNIEDTYCMFILLKSIILDIYNETNIYTNEEINKFNAFLRNDYGLEMKDYIGDFVNCSLGHNTTKTKLLTILGEDLGND